MHVERRERAQQIGGLVSNGIEPWLRALPEDCKLKMYTGIIPPLLKGETARTAVERFRNEVQRLEKEMRAVEAAPLPSTEAKAKTKAAVEGLVSAGTPNVFNLVEGNGEVSWPQIRPHVEIDGASSQVRETLIYLQVPHAIAIAAWMDPERFLARLDEEIDRRADDRNAIGFDERKRLLEEKRVKLLDAERGEEHAIETAERDGLLIPRRPAADAKAVLGVSH